MKKPIYFLASVLVAFAITAVKQHYYEVTQTSHTPAPIEKVITPTAEAKAPEEAPQESAAVDPPKPPEPPSTQASRPVTCREAIDQVWPTALRDGAKLVLVHENRREDPLAEGAVNKDEYASKDWGCFQINDHWHPAYFAEGDWRDPVWAAQYALKIYEGRQASTGNGWSAWYAVQGILW